MRIYRIVVDNWPTTDGRPWPRVVVNPDSHGPAYGNESIDDDDLGWLRDLRDDGGLDYFEMDRDQRDEVIGWMLPKTTRRHYLSRASAHKWVELAGALGAVCRVEESTPVEWPPVSSAGDEQRDQTTTGDA